MAVNIISEKDLMIMLEVGNEEKEVVRFTDPEIQKKVEEQLPEYTAKALKGYWNIALYGVDSREGMDVGQSDTIMVCSINKDTKEVKLASVYRDTYLETGDGSYNFRKAISS